MYCILYECFTFLNIFIQPPPPPYCCEIKAVVNCVVIFKIYCCFYKSLLHSGQFTTLSKSLQPNARLQVISQNLLSRLIVPVYQCFSRTHYVQYVNQKQDFPCSMRVFVYIVQIYHHRIWTQVHILTCTLQKIKCPRSYLDRIPRWGIQIALLYVLLI